MTIVVLQSLRVGMHDLSASSWYDILVSANEKQRYRRYAEYLIVRIRLDIEPPAHMMKIRDFSSLESANGFVISLRTPLTSIHNMVHQASTRATTVV
jgi:hypothetical protein